MLGVTSQEEDRKPAADQSGHINPKVKGQDGNEVFFRINKSTQIKKLMNAYCERVSVDPTSIAFCLMAIASEWGRHLMSSK